MCLAVSRRRLKKKRICLLGVLTKCKHPKYKQQPFLWLKYSNTVFKNHAPVDSMH